MRGAGIYGGNAEAAGTPPVVRDRKVHYVTSSETGYTLCGRYVTIPMLVTRVPAEVNCGSCLASAEGVTA